VSTMVITAITRSRNADQQASGTHDSPPDRRGGARRAPALVGSDSVQGFCAPHLGGRIADGHTQALLVNMSRSRSRGNGAIRVRRMSRSRPEGESCAPDDDDQTCGSHTTGHSSHCGTGGFTRLRPDPRSTQCATRSKPSRGNNDWCELNRALLARNSLAGGSG
jgi:hypothetical protein